MNITITRSNRASMTKQQIDNHDAIKRNVNAKDYVDEQVDEQLVRDAPNKSIYGNTEDEINGLHGELRYLNAQDRFDMDEDDAVNAAYLKAGNYYFTNLDRYSYPSPVVGDSTINGKPYGTSTRPYEENLRGDSGINSAIRNILVNGTGDTTFVQAASIYSSGNRTITTAKAAVGNTFSVGDTIIIYDDNATIMGIITSQQAHATAMHTGSEDMSSGFVYGDSNADFNIAIDGGVPTTVTLDTNCANVAEVVTEINASLDTALGDTTDVYASASGNYVALTREASGSSYSFALSSGDPNALETLGLSVGTYTGTQETITISEYGGKYPGDSIGDTATITTYFPYFGDTYKQFYNEYPTTKAGRNEIFLYGDTGDSRVFLVGDSSSDPDGDSLTYTWIIASRPTDSRVHVYEIGDSISFKPDMAGIYRITLWTHNNRKMTGDTVIITSVAVGDSYTIQKPTADVGVNQKLYIGDSFILSGDSSYDPEGGSLSYHWRFVSVPSASTLGDSADIDEYLTSYASFIPDEVGEYKVRLRVANTGDSDTKVLTAIVGDSVTFAGDSYAHSEEEPLKYMLWNFGNWAMDWRECLQADDYYLNFLNPNTGDTNVTARAGVASALGVINAEDYLGDSGLLKFDAELATRDQAYLASRASDIEMMLGNMTLTGTRSGVYSDRFAMAEVRLHKANGSLAKAARIYETNELIDNMSAGIAKDNALFESFFVTKKVKQDSTGENFLYIDGDTGLSIGDTVHIISEGYDSISGDSLGHIERTIDFMINVQIPSGATTDSSGDLVVEYENAKKIIFTKNISIDYKIVDSLRIAKNIGGNPQYTIPSNNTQAATSHTVGSSGSTYVSFSDINEFITVTGALEGIGAITGDPLGFPKTLTSSIAIDNATRSFSIIPPSGDSYYYYDKGIKYTKNSGDTVVFGDTTGICYFYFDGDTLAASAVISPRDLFTQVVSVSLTYWDADNSENIFLTEERHGFAMDIATHLHLHESFGTKYVNGLGLANMSTDGSGDIFSDATFSVANGEIHDEDIEYEIENGDSQTLSPIAHIPIMYLSGPNATFHKKDGDTFPVIYNGTAGYSGTRLPYNEWTGDSWVLGEVSNNNFVLVHYFASPDLDHPIFGIMGQNIYTKIQVARENAPTEIATLVTTGLPVLEFIPIASVIYQTSNGYNNTPKARIRTTDEGGSYIDFRTSSLTSSTGIISDHGSLSGLFDQDHPATAIPTDTGSFAGSLSTGDSDVQKALDTLDDHIHSAFLTLDGDTDNLDVSGAKSVFCDTTDGNIVIGGLSNGDTGQVIHIIKIVSGNNLTIENFEEAGTEDIMTNDGADIVLGTLGGATLVFSGTAWFVVSE